MSNLETCDYCGEYQHDCKCAAARKIAELQRERDEANDLIVHNDLKRVKQLSETRSDRNHFKQLAEERWQMCEELASCLKNYPEPKSAEFPTQCQNRDSALSHFHSLQQQKKDEPCSTEEKSNS